LAVVAAGLLLWAGFRVPTGQQGAYRTLSAQQAGGGAQLDIVFSPVVTQEGMREVLSAVDATIVNGPSAIGRYTIRLAQGGSSTAEIDAALRRLRADHRVRFAARSYMPGSGAAAQARGAADDGGSADSGAPSDRGAADASDSRAGDDRSAPSASTDGAPDAPEGQGTPSADLPARAIGHE
jgi:hypothetical protein